MASRFPRLNPTVLAVFLIVSLPILAAGILFVLLAGQNRMRDVYGSHLAHLAQQTSSVLDSYVYRKILDVSLLGRAPEVRTAAVAGSRQPSDAARVQALDKEWRASGQVPTALAPLFDGAASRFLADIVTNDQIYRELILTDRHGRLVAASNRASDYDQSDEEWWKNSFDDGLRGRVSVTDVRWDESARARAIEIAVPVLEPDANRLTGVLKAVIDARELLAPVAGLPAGASGQATLLRDNGSIVYSSRTGTDPNARFFATKELGERLQALKLAEGQGEGRVHFRARGQEGGEVVGVARSQLGLSYPNLNWLVAVSQSEREFLSPIRAMGLWLALLFAVTAILVLLLALWFSMRLAAPAVDAEMGLVEHAPGGEE
jgi:Cache domain